ncbi:MAG: geranylgeranylglyceryl/heptaprenylglyceryl phosphate synthase [Candidatus Cloacimonetes bacterium]|nr:geranylgeranylglyceryl/heptaprenylglyceryl phosphate synthase [Candidatus Cloacimonadota bacterium]
MKQTVYEKLTGLCRTRTGYICLIDPDRAPQDETVELATLCADNGADILLIGGSLMLHDRFHGALRAIHESVETPVVIFPGIYDFVSPHADAIFLLCMVSSRNPQMLIGEQVRAAPKIRACGLESIGTGYMLVESGRMTSVQYMSASLPIPAAKPDIAVAHALAAQYLGMRLIYMDAGSGAERPISCEMVNAVSEAIDVPLVVGGGIRNPEEAADIARAGADFIVTGTVLEDNGDPALVREIAAALREARL